mgnify:CR=1 FL=1
MGKVTWTEKHKQTLSHMWKAGYTASIIAEKLGKSSQSVRQYVSRHKKELDLEPRNFANWKNVKFKKPFDIEWQGHVPFGHWTITKPWRKVA